VALEEGSEPCVKERAVGRRGSDAAVQVVKDWRARVGTVTEEHTAEANARAVEDVEIIKLIDGSFIVKYVG
jgi:hypothetical protein